MLRMNWSMYTIFGANNTLRLLLVGYGVLVFGAASFLEYPDSPLGALRWALLSVGLFMTAAVALAGWSAFFSPWRMAFRLFAKLNEWVFPDLNGVWYGTTQSNWGVIEKKRMAAATRGKLELGELPSIPLRPGDIAMEVKADLFRIKIRSKLSATGGTSTTLSARADKTPTNDEFRLSYLYKQDTPEPASTDEGSHDGAATLAISLGRPLSMEGVYWTRRKWREGMNTAGMIVVKRVSELHAPAGTDLLEHARMLARQS